MEQRTPEWWAARCGKVTASRIGDLMARTQKGWGAPRKHYHDALVAERLTGKPVEKKVASLDRRGELEPDARAAYEFYSDNLVEEVGFIEHPYIPNAGCSPDGLIGSDGGLEIKCCDTAQHIEMLTTGVIDRGYVLQMQFGMACTDREWWDFASFDPLMPEELKLYVQRVPRDNELIASIETSVTEFLAEVEAKVEALSKLVPGRSPLLMSLEESLELIS